MSFTVTVAKRHLISPLPLGEGQGEGTIKALALSFFLGVALGELSDNPALPALILLRPC